MKIPYTEDEIDRATLEAVAVQGFKDAYVRPVVFRGSEMMAVAAHNTKIHVAIAVWQWPSYFDPKEKLKGIRLDISKWRRPAPDTAPTQAKAAGLYMICTLSKHEAEAKGYADAMMLDYRGLVAEATGANIFFVRDGELHTPIADCFLNGITRQSVMALARARRIAVFERRIEAGRTGRLYGMFHHRLGRGGDAGGGDRALPLHARRDQRDADERLCRRRAQAAQRRQARGIVLNRDLVCFEAPLTRRTSVRSAFPRPHFRHPIAPQPDGCARVVYGTGQRKFCRENKDERFARIRKNRGCRRPEQQQDHRRGGRHCADRCGRRLCL